MISPVRRRFLAVLSLVGLACVLSPLCNARQERVLFRDFGVRPEIKHAAALKKSGATFMTGSTSGFLVPDKSDAEFAKQLDQWKDCPLPFMACNGFIRPRNLRCVGEEANHEEVLVWAETAFKRLQQAGGKFMVFGSGGSRQLKKGWPKEKADEQFVALLKRMGPLAGKYGITVVVEQLNKRECNYLTRLGEVADIVRKVDDPNVRVCADLYHMATEGDTAKDLKAAMDVVAHVEIAEKNGRTYPGVGGQDFRPYFRVLRDAGYCGAINIEARGTVDQIGPAIVEIKKQEAEVLAE